MSYFSDSNQDDLSQMIRTSRDDLELPTGSLCCCEDSIGEKTNRPVVFLGVGAVGLRWPFTFPKMC